MGWLAGYTLLSHGGSCQLIPGAVVLGKLWLGGCIHCS